MRYLIIAFLLLGSAWSFGQIDVIDIARANHSAGPQIYGDGVMAQLNRGDMLMRQGRWEEAIVTYDNAIVQWPYWAPAYVKRALAKARMGRDQEARQDLNYAERLSRNSVALFNERFPGARLAILAGPEDWAGEHFVTEQPVQQRLTEIQLHKAAGDMVQASELIRELAEEGLLEQANLAFLKGNWYLLQSDYLTAIDYYNYALGQEESGPLYYNRGLARILSYNFRDGCFDLLQSVDHGYKAGEDQWADLCTF